MNVAPGASVLEPNGSATRIDVCRMIAPSVRPVAEVGQSEQTPGNTVATASVRG